MPTILQYRPTLQGTDNENASIIRTTNKTTDPRPTGDERQRRTVPGRSTSRITGFLQGRRAPQGVIDVAHDAHDERRDLGTRC